MVMRPNLDSKIFGKYLSKFGLEHTFQSVSIDKETQIILTIPSYKEPELYVTLKSLIEAKAPTKPIDVYVLVNASEEASTNDLLLNEQSKRQVLEFASKDFENLRFHLLVEEQMPKKNAGVGLARKIVMDFALEQFAKIEKDGLIVCFDGDSTVSDNYFLELEKAARDQEAVGGSLYFEHDLEQLMDNTAMLYYELFLRYYVRGLKFTGYPFSSHTVGSSMYCTCSAYIRIGGMNKRKAGEDFYFLHKLMAQGKFLELKDLKVIPSCRESDRVPFGTGRAMQNWSQGDKSKQFSYDPEVFNYLKKLVQALNSAKRNTKWEEFSQNLPSEILNFLEVVDFEVFFRESANKAKEESVFKKRLWIWWDGFRFLKLVHFLRDNYFPNIPAEEACRRLIGIESNDLEVLLEEYRILDRT